MLDGLVEISVPTALPSYQADPGPTPLLQKLLQPYTFVVRGVKKPTDQRGSKGIHLDA